MEEPLVHPSGQPDYVNPQLDTTITSPKQKAKLGADFDSFFKELDAKAASDPEPKVVEPANKEHDQAPVKDAEPSSPPEAPAKKEETEEPPAVAFAASDILKQQPVPDAPGSDPVTELDALELRADANAEQKSGFSKLKEIAKSFQKKAKAYENLAPLLKELGYTYDADNPEDIVKTIEHLAPQIKGWKTGAMSPEINQELQSLREMARAVDYQRSKEFIDEYVAPIQSSYVDILDEAAKYFDAPENDVQAFLETMKGKYTPKDLNSQWWSSQVIESMKKADPAIKQKVLGKVADLLRLQEKHDKALEGVSKNGDSYQKWQEKRNEQFSRDYDFQVRNEVETAFDTDKKHLKQWTPIPTKGVTDQAQLAQIEAHNQRFAALEKRFSDILVGVNSGPRRAARYALDYIEMQERLPELEKAVTEKDAHLKALESEVKKLKEEVTTKRKVSDVPLRSTAGTGAKPAPEKQKLSEVSGMKGLRAAFEKDLPGA